MPNKNYIHSSYSALLRSVDWRGAVVCLNFCTGIQYVPPDYAVLPKDMEYRNPSLFTQ